MVANIRSGSSPGGALRYNKEKVDKGEAEVLFRQKMLEPFDRYGRLDIDACMESFLPYLEANRRMTNTVFHVLPNPSPEDKLTDGQLREIACEYMERMSALTDDGYGVERRSSRVVSERMSAIRPFKVLRDVERQTERTGSARPTATNSQRCHEPA